MNNNIIQKSQLIRKIRKGVYQLPQGELVGYGWEHPGGLYHCYNCSLPTCEHTEAVDRAWLAGGSVSALSIPFTGEPVVYDSEADDYGLEPAL